MKRREDLIKEMKAAQAELMQRWKDRVQGAIEGFVIGECLEDRSPIDRQKQVSDAHWAVNTDVWCAFIEHLVSYQQLEQADRVAVMRLYEAELPTDHLIWSQSYEENPEQTVEALGGQKPLSFPDFVVARALFAGFWRYQSMDTVTQNAEHLCRLTHSNREVIGAGVVVAYLLHKLLKEEYFSRDELIWLSRMYSERVADYVVYAYDANLHFLKPNTSEDEVTTQLKAMGMALWAVLQDQPFFDTYAYLSRELRFFRPSQAVAVALLGAKVGSAAIPGRIGEMRGHLTAYRGSSLAYKADGHEKISGYVSGRISALLHVLVTDLRAQDSLLIIP